MSFMYPVCIREDVDIEALKEEWEASAKVSNFLVKNFTPGERALINFIVQQGLTDILGQKPAEDNPITDDPFAKPNPDYGIGLPMLDPNNPKDDDPFSTPAH